VLYAITFITWMLNIMNIQGQQGGRWTDIIIRQQEGR
jgi:hypothetical protein